MLVLMAKWLPHSNEVPSLNFLFVWDLRGLSLACWVNWWFQAVYVRVCCGLCYPSFRQATQSRVYCASHRVTAKIISCSLNKLNLNKWIRKATRQMSHFFLHVT